MLTGKTFLNDMKIMYFFKQNSVGGRTEQALKS